MSKEKTLAPSVTTTRDPKGLKFVSVVEGAYNKAKLSDEEAQRVNDTPGLADLIADFIAENRLTDRFKGEEAKSSYTYPPEYKGPKPIEEQIKAVAATYDLYLTDALKYAKNLPALPEGAEGWFAIPSPEAIAAKHFPEVTDPVEKYCRAVEFMFAQIKDSRAFYNYRDGQITAEHLRVHARTTAMLEKIAEAQKGSSILIIAAQVGLRHRGRSVRRAREVFAANEFGLTSLMMGTIALTHPERYVRWEQLHTDMPGDEFSERDGVFDKAPYLYFHGDEVKFDTNKVSYANGNYGSASGFLPQ